MDSKELAEIDASARAVVRRAYNLGRSEALKRVVDVLSTDRASADQLALMAPEESEATTSDEGGINGVDMSEKKAPWWAWPVR